MKVEQSKKFEPIVITLESLEEAKVMYSMLNCGWGQELKVHMELNYGNTKSREFESVRMQMYNSFEPVFKD